MQGLRPYLPLALLLLFALGGRPECERRTATRNWAPSTLQVNANACSELPDPSGRDWIDLAAIDLVDTLDSVWLRVERRATGNRVFVCASDDVPVSLRMELPIEVVRTDGEKGLSILRLATRRPLSITAWAEPPAIAAGDTARLHVEARDGVPPYTYRWTGDVSDPTLPDPIMLESGRVYIWVFDSVADGQPLSLHSAHTFVDVELILPDVHASADPDTVDPGEGSTLSVSRRPRSIGWVPREDLDYPWSRTPLATPAHTTDYTALATYDEGDVELGVRLTVRLGVTATAAPASVPPGGSTVLDVTLDGGGQKPPGNYTYTWLPPDGLDNPFARSTVARPARRTTYTVIVIDGFGQQATDSVTVEVDP